MHNQEEGGPKVWLWGVGRGQGATCILPTTHIHHIYLGSISRSHPKKGRMVHCLVSPYV